MKHSNYIYAWVCLVYLVALRAGTLCHIGISTPYKQGMTYDMFRSCSIYVGSRPFSHENKELLAQAETVALRPME